MSVCQHCQNGWLGGDLECHNGVVIDADVFAEGWEPDVIYPLAPCHPKFCKGCGGDGLWRDETGFYDCDECGGTGAIDGNNDSQERLSACIATEGGDDQK